MIRILFLLLALCALQSCSSDFNNPDARRSTAFYLRDTTEMRGELLAVIQDSVIVMRSDLGEADSLRTIKSIHYSALEFVVFRNDASAILNGIGGTLGGTLLGAVAGVGLGSIGDKGGHGGGWGGLVGFFFGSTAGAITGLVIGISSGANEVVEFYEREDLQTLNDFVRFREAGELRDYLRFRGEIERRKSLGY